MKGFGGQVVGTLGTDSFLPYISAASACQFSFKINDKIYLSVIEFHFGLVGGGRGECVRIPFFIASLPVC